MDFLETLTTTHAMLAEGAIAERLKYRQDISLHPLLFNTVLIYEEYGRSRMAEIYKEYRDVAAGAALPILLCAPTWRVDTVRIAQAGVDRKINRHAVQFMRSLQEQWDAPDSPIFVAGLVGPKNDCYQPQQSLSEDAAFSYHGWQIEELTEAGVDCIVAQTFPALEEALGVARACTDAGLPFLISFVTDRKAYVLDGTSLKEAVDKIDDRLAGSPAGYMVNCVHPSFLHPQRQPPELFARLLGIQANASAKDHLELESTGATQQDDRREWGKLMVQLNQVYGMKLLGGCCGTDTSYIDYIAQGLASIP